VIELITAAKLLLPDNAAAMLPLFLTSILPTAEDHDVLQNNVIQFSSCQSIRHVDIFHSTESQYRANTKPLHS
jgi:hypothetical protein